MFEPEHAAVGLYGVLSCSVSQRTCQIGARMVPGFLAALGLPQFLRGVLYGVSTFDPASLAAVAPGLTGVGILAR
jgi:hypothetical protein